MNYPNFDIDKLISGNITPYEIELLKNSEFKTNCTFNEFMSLKGGKKIQFLEEERFHQILSKIGNKKEISIKYIFIISGEWGTYFIFFK